MVLGREEDAVPKQEPGALDGRGSVDRRPRPQERPIAGASRHRTCCSVGVTAVVER
jgi:hypothetical protein